MELYKYVYYYYYYLKTNVDMSVSSSAVHSSIQRIFVHNNGSCDLAIRRLCLNTL